jgi:hypothetical protein
VNLGGSSKLHAGSPAIECTARYVNLNQPAARFRAFSGHYPTAYFQAPPMSSETRRITFSSEELVQAIANHRREEKQPFPGSRVRGAQVSQVNGSGLKIAFALDPATGDGTNELALKPTEVGVALIKFCRLKKIPLPRRASKSLAANEGQICLVLNLDQH